MNTLVNTNPKLPGIGLRSGIGRPCVTNMLVLADYLTVVTAVAA